VKNRLHFILFFLGLLFWMNSTSSAQIKMPFAHIIEVDILDTKLNKKDTTIVIRYDLKGSRKRLYDTRLYYSNNGGNSFKGPLRSIEGNIGDSSRAGKDKSIAWSFRKDNPYFDGQRTMFKIEATEIPKISNGGPENALRSLLIPGLGDTKVRNGYNYGWITAITYASLGTGVMMHFRAQNKYDDYEARIASSPENHQNLLNQARRARDISTGFLIAGGAIWLADVIGVYGRGLKNRRRANREKELLEGEGETSRGIPLIYPSMYQGTGQVSLLWQF
jgi:hypothetical protein